MGDRSNIVIQFDDEHEIAFYTHWGGSALPETLQEALKKAQSDGRLDDEPYLARIIFCTMVGEEWAGTTGFGIFPGICEEEHETIYVNFDEKTVSIGSAIWTYEDFMKQMFQ